MYAYGYPADLTPGVYTRGYPATSAPPSIGAM